MAITEYATEEDMEDAFEDEMDRLTDIIRLEEYIASRYDDLEYLHYEVGEITQDIAETEKELEELRNNSEF